MGETLLKGYLQIKCANPGRIVRKVCHFLAQIKSFEGGDSSPNLGFPLAFLTETSAGLAEEVAGGGIPHV